MDYRKSIFSLLLFISLFLSASNNAQQSSNNYVHYGLNISPVLNLHEVNTFGIPPITFCCDKFSNGQGIGLNTSLFGKYRVNKQFGLSSEFGLRTLSAEFISIHDIYLQNNPIKLQQYLHTNISTIFLNTTIQYFISNRFIVSTGLVVGITADKNYEYYEEIISPNNIYFDNGTRKRNQSNGGIAGINPRYFGISSGLQIRIPINNTKTLFISPFTNFWYGLRPTIFGLDWYINSLNIGFTLDHFPNGEIEFEEMRNLDTDGKYAQPITLRKEPNITIQLIDTQKTTVRTTVINYPIINKIFYSKDYQLLLIDSLDVYQYDKSLYSDYYRYALDTLWDRVRLSNEKITIVAYQHSTKKIYQIDSLLLKARHHLLQKGIQSNNIKTEIRAALPYPSNNNYNEGFEENNRIEIETSLANLTTCRNISKYDSIKPAIIKIQHDFPLETIEEWGIFDSSNTLIIKGNNSNIDSLISINAKVLGNDSLRLKVIITDSLLGKRLHSYIFAYHAKKDTILDSLIYYALFPYGKSELAMVDSINLRNFIDDIPQSMMIELFSYSDQLGDRAINESLAQKREEAVVRFLGDRYYKSFQYPGYKYTPGKQPEERFYNRIVKILVKKP